MAQAPQVAKAMPRSAHGIWVFAIAVGSLFVTVFAVWRNYRLARLLLFLGLAVVAISLFTDRPEGLRLGTTGEAYAGAQALLLGPFWVSSSRARPWRSWGPCSRFSCEPSGRCRGRPARMTSARSLAGRPG